MPYITTERVSEIRNQIKKEFPASDGWRFSITRHHYSMVCVTVLSAPMELRKDLTRKYEAVNEFYIKEHYEGEPKRILMRLREIMNGNNKIMFEDGDYGSVPSFYIDLNIGSFDKPFTISNSLKTIAA